MRFLAVAVAAALVVTVTAWWISRLSSVPESGTLAHYARQAAIERRDETTITWLLDENGSSGPLNLLLRHSSVVIARSSGRQEQTVRRADILTWHVLGIERTLRRGPDPKHVCQEASPPDGLLLGPAEIAVPLVQGSTRIDGVLVAMGGTHSRVAFPEGKRYVLLVLLCPDRGAVLPQGGLDVFELSETGAFLRPDDPDRFIPFPFVNEMLALGTVEALEARLEELSRSAP